MLEKIFQQLLKMARVSLIKKETPSIDKKGIQLKQMSASTANSLNSFKRV